MKNISLLLSIIMCFGLLLMFAGCDREWTGTVRGVITEGLDDSENTGETENETGVGIPDVTVKIHSQKNGFEISVLTDATGAYSIENARWGPNKVEVYHPRYEQVSKYVDIIRDETVELDFEIDRLTEYVDPVLSVQVVNTNGDPVNQAVVDLYQLKETSYEYYFFLDTRTSDESGFVEFYIPRMYEEEVSEFQLRVVALDYSDEVIDFALSWTNSKPSMTVILEGV
ncbi:carboxypeptidase-like regulatory domain-containing protein [bacterium]|nr:carboxypeptidase-like regulatory domain-containing protein [bacterium]